jgi:hypothetical protein
MHRIKVKRGTRQWLQFDEVVAKSFCWLVVGVEYPRSREYYYDGYISSSIAGSLTQIACVANNLRQARVVKR